MKAVFLAVLIGIISCSPANTVTLPDPEPEILPMVATESNPETDIDALLASLSVRQKIAQMMHVWAYGEFQADASDRFRRVERLVREEQIGGFIFSRGNIYDQAILTNKLQQISRIPLWISQDMEFGAAMRINATTRFAPAMAVAATRDPKLDYMKGYVTAMEAKAVGVHQIFAPVMDVNNNPANPVINTRSYSENAALVSQFGVEFIRGVKAAGLVSTVKHFPGHGDTATDSHIGLPVINHDWARLDSVELVPFRAAIRAGVESVMSAHISFPKLGSEPGLPGTLDPKILTDMLRDSLGFDGLITTDALEMEGVSEHYSPGDALIRAILAGADMLLIPPDVASSLDAAVLAVERGQITIARIDASVRRILEWKKRMGLFENRTVDLNALSSLIAKPEYQRAADEIAKRSITVIRNQGGILPIRPERYRRITAISMADDRTGTTGSGFATALRGYHGDVRFWYYDQRSKADDVDAIVSAAGNADLIVVGSFVFLQTSSGKISLTDAQSRFLKRLKATGKPIVLISFGNPYIVIDLPDADVHLLAWANTQSQIDAATNALFGATDIDGRMPISIPGTQFAFGAGLTIPKILLRNDAPETVGLRSDSLNRIDAIMETTIRDSIFPGASVTVLKDGIIAFERGYGYHDYSKTRRVRANDIFDLASVSKVMGTTLATMKLVDEGKLKLEDPISKYIPEYARGDKAKITIAHFLSHTSGLPPFRVYVDSLKTRNAILAAIRKEALVNAPGERYVYSDLGMILLGSIIEQLTGMSQDVYLARTFYTPMGMTSTLYNPAKTNNRLLTRILPTEHDTVYRKIWIHGVVHDERAFYMDGVAGHAGLFSNGRDVAIFASLMLNKGVYGGARYLKPETVELFTTKTTAAGHRALGFDMKSPSGFSSAGTLAGPKTFGHTGFTGTSVWIDPDRNIAIIVLTNRTYPYRGTANGVGRVRSAVADQVFRSLNP
jgi:beta-N-acetylhexosaminidase